MSNFPTVFIEQARGSAWSTTMDRARQMNPVNPGDNCLAGAVDVLRRRGMTVVDSTAPELDAEYLAGADVYVIPHLALPGIEHVTGDLPPRYSPAELDVIETYVRAGGGLVILAECDTSTSGNNLAELAARFGVGIRSLVVQESPGERRAHGNASWVLADLADAAGLLAGVESACFYRTGVLDVADDIDATVLARTSATAWPAGEPLAVAVRAGVGRVVIFADSDLFGDDSIDEFDHRALWANSVTWASRISAAAVGRQPATADIVDSSEWLALKGVVEQLRLLQSDDGSVGDAAAHSAAAELCERITAAVADLAPLFDGDRQYLLAVQRDIRRWAADGFGRPDFGESLAAFRPDLDRSDGVGHLVVFPMYTQNGHAGHVFEALVLHVIWPDWLADVERHYDNRQFLSVALDDFTSGYDTNSAVLFPETISVARQPEFHWGAIFCDREAARFRRVVGRAAELLSIALPPDGDRLIASQPLAQSTFAMWDLIHDRTHSRGELPFDPFMIKQRMPFWLYSLEELRCDLTTFRAANELERQGHPYGLPVQLAILCDRLFRFPITGDRVRNYDGLGGQLLFGYLHRAGSLRWRDNRLSFDWKTLPTHVLSLGDQIEELYRTGIDRTKVGQWLATYRFVSEYLEPAAGSSWRRGEAALPLDGPPRGLVDLVLPDEFPLNVFYESLKRKMQPVIDSTRGITAAA